MGPISNKELVAKYFTDVADNAWKCDCGKKSVKGGGWQNLLDHVSRDYLDSIDEAKSSSQATVSSFFSQKRQHHIQLDQKDSRGYSSLQLLWNRNARMFTKLEPILVETLLDYMGKLTFLAWWMRRSKKLFRSSLHWLLTDGQKAWFITWLFLLLLPTLRSCLDLISSCYHPLFWFMMRTCLLLLITKRYMRFCTYLEKISPTWHESLEIIAQSIRVWQKIAVAIWWDVPVIIGWILIFKSFLMDTHTPYAQSRLVLLGVKKRLCHLSLITLRAGHPSFKCLNGTLTYINSLRTLCLLIFSWVTRTI